ncbi:hypothetical protein OESDEN_06356 [Oesophagostomum dentatum]|uniref:Uncharacterized protein n=1 Tax=Oesophagostomum dentatum TaxID=61180 RepID=A0A0B1TD26_OESDE|nr:hypothetical protein OESDEN_06356 [Oesophagostomum dentatum]
MSVLWDGFMVVFEDTDDDKVHMISLCQRHRSAKIFDDGASSGSNQQCGSDEETEGQASSGMLGHLEQICYQFVDYREIAERLSLDHLCVSDVFEYWKWRRLSNNGKPLIDNLQDEITIDEPEQLQLELPEFVEGGYGTQLTGKRGRGRPKKGATEGKDIKSASSGALYTEKDDKSRAIMGPTLQFSP